MEGDIRNEFLHQALDNGKEEFAIAYALMCIAETVNDCHYQLQTMAEALVAISQGIGANRP